MTPTDHTQWDELAAGYAIHALEPDEETAFTAHLAGCDDCRSALDGFLSVAADLGGLSDDADEPPPWIEIRPRLLTLRVVEDDAGRSVAHQRFGPARRWLAVAAGIVGLVGAGVLVGHQFTKSAGKPTAVAACQQRSDCRVIKLQSATATAADLIVANGQVHMASVAMSPAAAEHVYWLWQLPRDGAPVALMEFRTALHGQTATVSLRRPYVDTVAFAVSLEPAGTVPSHPTQVLATGAAGI